MKKIICVLMVTVMLIGVFSIPVSANADLSVILDGEVLEFDVQPQIINGRTMVPMRKIFESLGASVLWDGNDKKITAARQDITVVMQIDNTHLFVNGNDVVLDVPPQLIDGRILVPVRAIAESFDIHVIWDDSFNNVVLSTYIPFETSIQTYDYLCDWLIENGEPFANHLYIGWKTADGADVQIRCYPDSVNGEPAIAFFLNSYEYDNAITSIFLWRTYDKSDVYATYMSGTDTCTINGDINMKMHTDNYPLSCIECEPGEFETEYHLLEETRKRINLLLKECDILMASSNIGVNLNTMGFKKH